MTHRILRAWSSMTPIRWIFVLTGLGFMIRLAYVLFVERGDPLSGDGDK